MNSFYELISATEQFLGITNSNELVKNVCLAFVLMSVGIFIFFIFTLITLIFHQISKKAMLKHKARYNKWIISFLLDPEVPVPNAPLLYQRPFRNALLELLLITKGHEKGILLKLYRSSGFWNKDLDLLKNIFWYKRLAALVRLDQWQFCLGLDVLSHLLDDENFNVRQIALKNLSRTKDPEEAFYLLEQLPIVKTHYSVLYETIYRLIRIHREMVIACLQDKSKAKLWPFILKVTGDSRIIEGVPSLISIAQHSEDSDLREKAIKSLGQIGDPRGLIILQTGIRSKFANERLASLKALFNIDFNELLPFQDQLKNDPSPDVQNWMDHYLRGGT